MSSLAEVLRPDGVLGVMLYARYGRLGVEMMQGVFREMGLGQDQRSIDTVREALAALSQDHPVQSYLNIAPDLHHDAGIVDTFLHSRDRTYTVDDCLELVEQSGLIFQDWLIKSPYYPLATRDSGFLADIAMLPEREQWSVMERLNHRNGCHFFTACHRERPTESYVIDFSSDAFVNLVPDFRHACSLIGPRITRHDWSCELDRDQLALMELVDGQRTIGEIVSRGERGDPLRNQGQAIEAARTTFRSLWQLDVLSMEIRV
jgi:hypothetical protein